MLTAWRAAAIPATAAVYDPYDPIVSPPPSPSLSSVSGVPLASGGRALMLASIRFRYDTLCAFGRIFFSANSVYLSSTLVINFIFSFEPAPACFAPRIAAGRRTALSRLPVAVMCWLHLESVRTTVPPLPNVAVALLKIRSQVLHHSRVRFLRLILSGISLRARRSSPLPLITRQRQRKTSNFFKRSSALSVTAVENSLRKWDKSVSRSFPRLVKVTIGTFLLVPKPM
mmetsp:Transcript_26614/g.39545  ORF Transcript_26614/g.39545 Transcript_26614/m.39545 type:complete len:228 (-) Transcript_26614:2735-3418(-)